MKTILKNLMIASLLLASTAASAQKTIAQDLETWMSSLISQAIDNKVEVSKSLGQERDIQKEGTPLKWRCDIMTFTLPKKQRPLLDEMIKAFEANGTYNSNCYGVSTLTTGNPQNEGKRNLMVGEDPNRYVTIGEQYGNYINVNILDASDTSKTHRYAYALEWKEDSKGNTFARYIVTYAKIPSAVKTIGYSGKAAYNNLLDKFLEVDGEWLPRDSTALINDKMNDNSFLTNFNNLNDYYWKHSTSVTTAISIYQLCKLGREFGAFKSPESTEDWEKLMVEIDKLIECAKTETDRKYFKLAREELQKMKGK